MNENAHVMNLVDQASNERRQVTLPAQPTVRATSLDMATMTQSLQQENQELREVVKKWRL